MDRGSQIRDIFDFKVNKAKYPMFSSAEGGLRGVVEPGDILFIPQFCKYLRFPSCRFHIC
jgi:hypothetical protein